jgi:hypothetical protein
MYLKRFRFLLFLFYLMLNYNIVAILNILVLCALIIRTSYFDSRREKLVLKLLNNPAYDAGVTTSFNQSFINAFTFLDLLIQSFYGGIEI